MIAFVCSPSELDKSARHRRRGSKMLCPSIKTSFSLIYNTTIVKIIVAARIAIASVAYSPCCKELRIMQMSLLGDQSACAASLFKSNVFAVFQALQPRFVTRNCMLSSSRRGTASIHMI